MWTISIWLFICIFFLSLLLFSFALGLLWACSHHSHCATMYVRIQYDRPEWSWPGDGVMEIHFTSSRFYFFHSIRFICLASHRLSHLFAVFVYVCAANWCLDSRVVSQMRGAYLVTWPFILFAREPARLHSGALCLGFDAFQIRLYTIQLFIFNSQALVVGRFFCFSLPGFEWSHLLSMRLCVCVSKPSLN